MPYKQTEPDRIGLHDWIDEYDKYLAEMSKRIATIQPWQKGNSVLIGDEAAHGDEAAAHGDEAAALHGDEAAALHCNCFAAM